MIKKITPILLLFAAVLYPFGKNKIAYKTFDWQVYPTPHFEIYHYPEEVDSLQKVASMAESAYEILAGKFNFRIEKKIPFIIYRVHSEFEQTNVMLNFIPEGVGAFAEPVRNRMVMPIDIPDDKLQKLILHELTHVFQFEFFFQGNTSKHLWYSPPQWFMEGLASYMADDEDAFARMILRDMVVNDRIPSITSEGISGYFAYRFGHAAFDFIEQVWGEEGLRSVFYEFRANMTKKSDQSIKRAFNLTPREFDRKFRLYLRNKYLPILVETGEPQEYGQPFLVGEDGYQVTSPVFSPAGEMIAAISTKKHDTDVVLISADGRKTIKNLTPRQVQFYEYMVASFLTMGPDYGKDLAFSSDGNHVAYVVRHGEGREIVVQNIYSGDKEIYSFNELSQERSPAFHPDGKHLVFQAYGGTSSDIFLFNMESGNLSNLTDDQYYDGAPSVSPDGEKVLFSSEVGADLQIFELSISDPSDRKQLTFSPGKHITAQYDPDGRMIYYAWDREDIYNIYRLNPEIQTAEQLTDVVTGCFSPAIHETREGKPFLIFTGIYMGRIQLFYQDNPEVIDTLSESPVDVERAREVFQPAIEVPIDPDRIEKDLKFKLTFEDARVEIGISSDQAILSNTYLRYSDLMGYRHAIFSLQSIQSFTNSELAYMDLSHRMQWGATVYDRRYYYFTYNYFQTGGRWGERERLARYTGGMAYFQYPFNFTHRMSLGIGGESRSLDYPYITTDDQGNQIAETYHFNETFPYLYLGYSGDTTIYRSYGPHAGRRYSLSYSLSPQLEGKPKAYNLSLDFRQYIPFGARSEIAIRLLTARSGGEYSSIYTFGGTDTLRGYDFREFYGTNIAFTNIEIRFPLIDILQFPFMQLRNVRGRIFCDIGGAWFEADEFRWIKDNRLEDGVSSIGLGITVRLMGLDLNWDFARKWNLQETESGTVTTFWIGRSF